ncbi:MAG: hypothetical protein EOO89_28675, partial [Pedobacter sp.]
MKKFIIYTIIISISTMTYGESEQDKLKACEAILGAGIFNGFLEKICGFEGHVKDRLLTFYDEAQCRAVVPQETVDETSMNVAEDTKMRISAFGEHTFCEVNMKPYVDLKEE